MAKGGSDQFFCGPNINNLFLYNQMHRINVIKY